MYNICNNIIKKHNLHWQYPVISEKVVFIQQKDNENYIGLPWATIIDLIMDKQKVNIRGLLQDLLLKIDKNRKYITFCQHIYFIKIIPILHYLNIKTLYTSHKIKGKNNINKILIKPAPLYAVNIENKKRNDVFNEINLFKINLEEKYKLLNDKKDLFYSFIGNYNNKYYLTNIRKKILKMEHHEKAFVKSIDGWHFENIVYQEQIKHKKVNDTQKKEHNSNTKMYNLFLLRSRFSLCPSGSGPNSIRLWESLALGSIPVLLADTLDLPKHELWKKAIVFMPEKDIDNIVEILSNISEEKEKEMRMNCLKLYNHFKDNFLNF
jgi:hypothetical protein